MRIEQRIGRIDRRGQTSEKIRIVNIITPGTVDADIYERCLLQIGIFDREIGASDEILGEMTRELQSIAKISHSPRTSASRSCNNWQTTKSD